MENFGESCGTRNEVVFWSYKEHITSKMLWMQQCGVDWRLLYVVQEIYKDRKKFSKAVFEVASSDLVNMGISVVSYTLKDLKDDEVSL